ncbi:MAG TPA: hypothetical protein VHB98_07060 [Chloroflexota bacterium]|nr:hypothetical protein [Chloroflexota bacterium]
MMEELTRVATDAARTALEGWSPDDPHCVDRLAQAIGEAVAVAVQRQEQLEARHTALVMETSCRAGEQRVTWTAPRDH